MDDHHCEAIVVTCIDFRLQETIIKWLSENFQPKTYDRVALAGGVKDLNTVLGQIDIAVRLHHIKKVVIINHEDCGAYGPEGRIDHHVRDLKQVKKQISEQFPNLEVETYYLHLDGTFEPTN